MRRLNKRNAHTPAPDGDAPFTNNDDRNIPRVVDVSDSESEEDGVPTMRRHNPRRSGKVIQTRSSVKRSARIAGKEVHYMELFCSLQGEEDILDVAGVTNVVQRDECFLSSVDLNEDVCSSSPATRFLAANSYVSDDETLEDSIHPYTFSAKVQTHCTDNPLYKDILRLQEEERKLWDVAMVKELKF